MMLLLLNISLMLSIIFLFMNHPLSMGLILLAQTSLISLITGFMSNNFWYSYILFLVMVGGMLVLFIYMTSIASNEKFKFSNKIMLIMMLTMMIMFINFIYMDNFNLSFIDYSFNYTDLSKQSNLSLNKFLNFPSNIMLFLMIIYLFITLIAVVKISNIKYGPLRQKF